MESNESEQSKRNDESLKLLITNGGRIMKKLALLGLVIVAVLASSLASAQGWHSHRRHYRSYSYGRHCYTPSYYGRSYYAPSYYGYSSYCAPSYYPSYSYYAPAYCPPSYGYYRPSYYGPSSYISFGYRNRGTGFHISLGGW